MAQKVSFPSVNASLVPEAPTASVDPRVTTIIGQMTTGTATAGALLKDIDLNTQDALFGADSQVTAMINAFRDVNKISRVDVLPVADAGGATDSTGTIAFTGTATETASLTFYIGSSKRKYVVDVVSADTATAVGTKLEALITADTTALVDAVNTLGSVALTAVNGGTVADKYTLLVEGTVAGISVALTAMSGGATDPSMTGLDALLTEQTDIVIPYEYDRTAFLTLLGARFNIDNDILEGRLFTGSTDSKANLVTAGDALNDQSLIIFGDKPVDTATKKGSAILELDCARAAHFAGLRALRLEDGVSIADYMTTTVSRDNVGGVHTSSLPYANTATLLPVVPAGEGFTSSEASDLKTSGIALMGNNLADNTLIVGEVVTTYKTNTQGFADTTYKYLSYVDTATAAREFIWKSLKIDYAQSRLTLGTPIAGYDMATTGKVRSSMVDYYSTLAGRDYVLLQSGVIEQDNDGRSIVDIYKANLVVTLDVKEGEIQIESILPLITQTRTIIAPLNIRFNVNEIAS